MQALSTLCRARISGPANEAKDRPWSLWCGLDGRGNAKRANTASGIIDLKAPGAAQQGASFLAHLPPNTRAFRRLA